MLRQSFLKVKILPYTVYGKSNIHSSIYVQQQLQTTPELVELFVDDKPVKVLPGTTVLKAAALAGVEIPRFCYHERLAVAGNCRMCLVEIEKQVKVGTYIEKLFMSEVSGNIIDLCPVGALTSKPYAFVARPWENYRTDSIDVHDAVGSNIVVSHRSGEVLRILPRVNEDINEEWLSDKARFSYDGLKRQRIITPMLKRNGKLQNVEWEDALVTVAQALQDLSVDESAAIAGKMTDAESLIAMKDLLNSLGSELLTTEQPFPISGVGVDFRKNYLFNNKICNLEDADVLLLIGANPRYEAPIMNLRIRKGYLNNEQIIGIIGPKINLSYNYQYLGQTPDIISQLQVGSHPFFEILMNAKKPMVILGAEQLSRKDGARILAETQCLCRVLKNDTETPENWDVMNILHTNASQVAALDLGYVISLDDVKKSQPKVLFLLGADDKSIQKEDFNGTFIVYLGSHGDYGASIADVVLPGAAYTEKYGTYVNLEGRSQQTSAAITPPGLARSDWKIIRAISEIAGSCLPYDDIHQVRKRISEVAPHILRYGDVEDTNYGDKVYQLAELDHQPFLLEPINIKQKTLDQFYMTDSISKASPTMAKCVQAVLKQQSKIECR
ncbi:NADH-ubiquinone oxidoreductase 75 kDa subunit, mitochondrial isoform X2 [Phymastichus coffea]|uniref:NADH-ubiquinone oxidoreductase 75 kDa subunit, mitochondrial isoform X2 n=1 Tax=Phymastichus coffea TaxID=108790 RepID=UPI00273C4CC9|nr:NADH-ubiquinone oxidoreductase 75 kDa subunit, mitochondrial isoform X2 [Phymastichus coffea]